MITNRCRIKHFSRLKFLSFNWWQILWWLLQWHGHPMLTTQLTLPLTTARLRSICSWTGTGWDRLFEPGSSVESILSLLRTQFRNWTSLTSMTFVTHLNHTPCVFIIVIETAIINAGMNLFVLDTRTHWYCSLHQLLCFPVGWECVTRWDRSVCAG